jgi:two-component system cell cycle sensor histidine kinase/response regulator CckA
MDRETLTAYRIRTVRLGVRATLILLGALLVFFWLARSSGIPLTPLLGLWTIVLAGACAAAVLPWERLFRQRLGLWLLHAWSVSDIVLATFAIALMEPINHNGVLLYILTTIFFAMTFPVSTQFILFGLTIACYLIAWRVDFPQTEASAIFLRLSVLGAAAYMCSFLSRELVGRMQAAVMSKDTIEREKVLYESLVKAQSDLGEGVAIVDIATQRFFYVNDALCKMYGYTREELLGLPSYLTLLSIDSQQEASERTRSQLEGSPHADRFQGVVVRKDGELLNIEAAFYPTEGTQVIALVRDATERNRAIEALRESEERNRTLSELTSDFGYSARFEPDGSTRLEWVTGAFERITGYTLEEAAEIDLMHPKDLPEIEASFERLKQGRPDVCEFRITTKSGGVRWLRRYARPIQEEDGSVRRFLGAAQDVTEAKRRQREVEQLETQLGQAQRMEAVGRLAGGVAHDFNNLLTAILGYCDLALEAELPNQVRSDIEEVRDTAAMGADLANQLLDISRRRVLKREVVDIGGVISSMATMLRRVVGDDIVLSVDLNGADFNVEADRSQIEQVVLNLVLNARDAMPEGGEIKMYVRQEDVSDALASRSLRMSPGPHVVFTIADEGPGVDPAIVDRIFEPFFTTKDRSRGVGLGLATVYGIVSQYSGHIDLKNRSEGGAEFSIYLPATSSTKALAGLSAGDGHLNGNETILLAEDDAGVRVLARRAFERRGYAVLEAEGGPDALALARETSARIDLLVTDVVMPGLNGKDLAHRLSMDLPEIRVLYMSGYADGALPAEGDFGIHKDFIAKPFHPDELVAKARHLLDKKIPKEASRS